MRAAVAAVVALSLLASGAGCAAGAPAAPDRLVIAAGEPGDVYRILGEALGAAAHREWSARVTVQDTRGSLDNLRHVAEGRADVGFATADAAAIALAGNAPFERALPIRAVARLYDDYLQVVSLAEAGIERLADLDGRRVSTGPAHSGTGLAATRVLHSARVVPGAQPEHSPRDGAQALVDGEIDAFFVAGGLPTPVVAEAAEQAPLRLLDLPASLVADLQGQYGEYYQAQAIPAGTYPEQPEVETVSMPNLLVVHADLPADTAYQLAALLFATKEELVAAHVEARRLDHRSALATLPVDLHPGAQRYYRDTKPLAGHTASR